MLHDAFTVRVLAIFVNFSLSNLARRHERRLPGWVFIQRYESVINDFFFEGFRCTTDLQLDGHQQDVDTSQKQLEGRNSQKAERKNARKRTKGLWVPYSPKDVQGTKHGRDDHLVTVRLQKCLEPLKPWTAWTVLSATRLHRCRWCKWCTHVRAQTWHVQTWPPKQWKNGDFSTRQTDQRLLQRSQNTSTTSDLKVPVHAHTLVFTKALVLRSSRKILTKKQSKCKFFIAGARNTYVLKQFIKHLPSLTFTFSDRKWNWRKSKFSGPVSASVSWGCGPWKSVPSRSSRSSSSCTLSILNSWNFSDSIPIFDGFRSFQEIGPIHMVSSSAHCTWRIHCDKHCDTAFAPCRHRKRIMTLCEVRAVCITVIFTLLVTESFSQFGTCSVLPSCKNRPHWMTPNLTDSPLDWRPPRACQLEWSAWSEWNLARGPSAPWAPEQFHIPYTKPGRKDMKDMKDRNATRSIYLSSIESIVLLYHILCSKTLKYMSYICI